MINTHFVPQQYDPIKILESNAVHRGHITSAYVFGMISEA